MSSRREPKQAVDWHAPTTMLAAFLAGILFSVGHHIFYHNLDGQAVDEAKYDQQTNIRIGTALSYLVRVALAVAVSVAYWQIFWRTLQRKQLPLSTVDSLADLLGSLLSFFDVTALRANPVLFSLAAISWLIPFGSIVTPATLTISPMQVTSYNMTAMAGINFGTGPMATINYLLAGGGPNAGNLSGPPSPSYDSSSQPLSRLALATAFQGQLPNIPPPVVNSSYRLQFYAPSVRCNPASKDILRGFNSAVGCDVLVDGDDCAAYYRYLCWAPNDSIVPFSKNSMYPAGSLPIDPDLGPQNYLGTIDSESKAEPATLFLAIDASGYGEWIVFNCSLWNTTYTVDFDFSAIGTQRISVIETYDINSVSVDWGPLSYDEELQAAVYGPGINYQALMECFGKSLVGSIYTDTTYGYLHESGNVLQTDVAYTKELFPVYNMTIATSDTYNTTVLDAMQSPNFNRSLVDVVEEMFQNMTLALFSKQAFLTDEALPTNITIHSVKNIYVYSPSHLLLAYGLAVGFSFAAVVLGFVNLWLSKASYSFKFSTVMRATCEFYIYALVPNAYRTGADPLPRDLKSVRIQVGPHVPTPTGEYKSAVTNAAKIKLASVTNESDPMLT